MNQSPLAASPRTPHTVVMVGFEDAQILDITGPLEVFARTSRWLRSDLASSARWAPHSAIEGSAPPATR